MISGQIWNNSFFAGKCIKHTADKNSSDGNHEKPFVHNKHVTEKNRCCNAIKNVA